MRIAPSQREMVRPQSMPRIRVRARRLRRDAGFTLTELLVVIVLVGMMALLAVPWFVKISQRQQIKSAAQEISIALAAARMTAVKRNAQVAFVIASTTPPLEFRTIEPNPPAPTPTPLPKIVRLPAKAAQFKQTPTGGTIIFGGDGRIAASADPRIIIEGPVGMRTPNAITILTNGNGRIEVITPTTWQ